MVKHNYPGRLIIFEGIDGCGKSTHARLLKESFDQKEMPAVLISDPDYNSQSGKKIAEVLSGREEMNPLKLQELFTKNRRERLDNLIIPILKLGGIVVSDRYFWSTIAYGVGADDLNWDELVKLSQDLIFPDLTFFINTSLKWCLERLERRVKRGDSNFRHYEKEEKLEKVWDVYSKLFSCFNNQCLCHIINGTREQDEIFKDIERIAFL